MNPFTEYANEVRRYIGDGHEMFTDDHIRAAKDSFTIAWPQPWRVAHRLAALAVPAAPGSASDTPPTHTDETT